MSREARPLLSYTDPAGLLDEEDADVATLPNQAIF